MTRTAVLAPLGAEFNNFLFAPIGEDKNGMLVSVVSALARHDVDPWEEAAGLARLPREAGTERLASLIATLPDGLSAHRDSGTTAARLIALLPSPASHNFASGTTSPDAAAVTKFRAGVWMYIIFMAFVLGAQWMVGSQQPPAPTDAASLPFTSADSPQTPPPSSGQ